MGKKWSWPTFLTVIGIIVAILGIFIPIINRNIINKRNILVSVKSEISLITGNDFFDDLQLYYNEEKIDNLSKNVFVLINDGNTPFVDADFIEPIKIKFDENINILHTEILSSNPENLKPNIISEDSALLIDFNLLNPKEYIEFCIYYTGADLSNIEIESRIANLNSIDFLDERNISLGSEERRKANWLTWVLGIMGSMFFLILVGNIKHIREHRRIRSDVKEMGFHEYIKAEGLNTRDRILIFVNERMKFLSSTQQKKLKVLLSDNNCSIDIVLNEIRTELATVGSVEKSLNFYIVFVIATFLYFIWFYFL